jgi:hypothetical protein
VEGALIRIAILFALVACGGREPVVAPSEPAPRLQLVRCSVATPPPVIADDGVTFGGLTKAEVLELKRSTRNADTNKLSSVTLGTPRIAGPLDPAVINRVVRSTLPVLRACYERAFASKPTMSPRITIAFSVELDGVVSTASVAGAVPEMQPCVVDALRKLRFPRPRGGLAHVSYPISFEPGTAAPVSEPAHPEEPSRGAAWTPFALDGSPPLDVAPLIARGAEVAVRARLDRLATCFHGLTPQGSLRAMLDIDPTGALRAARIGGLADPESAACLRRELAGLRVKSPTLDAAEVACDLARGDARRWRVDPAEYAVIRATRAGLEHAGTRIAVGASEPDALPGNRTYLVLADQDTPGTVLELALTWAFESDATLVAIADGTPAPPLVGVGRSTFALGDPRDDPLAAPVSIEIYPDRVMVCTGASSQQATLADGAKALEILGTRLATFCRTGHCASTIGLAVDGDAPATALPPVLDALRRAGFERVLIGGGVGCRPTP